jgi:hypothetical protein
VYGTVVPEKIIALLLDTDKFYDIKYHRSKRKYYFKIKRLNNFAL